MRTAFHLISSDPDERKTALNIVRNLLEDDSVDLDDVAVVAQAGGIEPVTEDGEGSDRVRALLSDGVTVTACANTMESRGIDESDLLAGVGTAPTGVGELTRLQHDGYAYIRP